MLCFDEHEFMRPRPNLLRNSYLGFSRRFFICGTKSMLWSFRKTHTLISGRVENVLLNKIMTFVQWQNMPFEWLKTRSLDYTLENLCSFWNTNGSIQVYKLGGCLYFVNFESLVQSIFSTDLKNCFLNLSDTNPIENVINKWTF